MVSTVWRYALAKRKGKQMTHFPPNAASRAWSQGQHFSQSRIEVLVDIENETLSDVHELVREIHHTTVQGPKQRLATLTQIQRDLYDVASEETLMMA